MARTGRPKQFDVDLHIRIEKEINDKIEEIMKQEKVERSEAARILLDMGIKYDDLKH
jgi:hypothetical protein